MPMIDESINVIKVKRIPVPENMIEVNVNDGKCIMYFTERTFVESFETVARLWEDLYYGKHGS
jgi:hypothetical protein